MSERNFIPAEAIVRHEQPSRQAFSSVAVPLESAVLAVWFMKL